jgi:cell division protein FtsW (lipid II flippase)
MKRIFQSFIIIAAVLVCIEVDIFQIISKEISDWIQIQPGQIQSCFVETCKILFERFGI